jgi:hypothetical protein
MWSGRSQAEIGRVAPNCIPLKLPSVEDRKGLMPVTRRRAAQYRTIVVSIYKMTLRIKAMRNDKRKFKSSAFEAIHESAAALHKIGAIDSAAMQDFDAAALQTSPVGAAPDVNPTDRDR